MADSRPILEKEAPDALSAVLADVITSAQWKLYLCVLLIFIFVSSDLLVNSLKNIPGAVIGRMPSNYGIFLQGLLMTLLVIVMDVLISQHIF